MTDLRIQKITSFDSPELQPYATLRRPLEHERQGIFVAESIKVVRRLLESQFTVVSVVLPEKWLAEFRPLLEARPENVAVYLAEKKLLETLVGFSMFQGVLAVGKVPPPVSLDEILAKSPKPQLFVAVDELTNAENLGALVRNCVAFGVQALIVGETSSSPFLRRAVRNSMGTIFQLPVIELAKLGQRHQFTNKPHATKLTSGGMFERIARARRPLHRRASAHGQEDFVAGGFYRRLLHRFRQRRRGDFSRRFWQRATKRWRFRCRRRWIRLMSAPRRRFFFTKWRASVKKFNAKARRKRILTFLCVFASWR